MSKDNVEVRLNLEMGPEMQRVLSVDKEPELGAEWASLGKAICEGPWDKLHEHIVAESILIAALNEIEDLTAYAIHDSITLDGTKEALAIGRPLVDKWQRDTMDLWMNMDLSHVTTGRVQTSLPTRVDLHAARAAKDLGKDIKDVTDAEREVGKTRNHNSPYLYDTADPGDMRGCTTHRTYKGRCPNYSWGDREPQLFFMTQSKPASMN